MGIRDRGWCVGRISVMIGLACLLVVTGWQQALARSGPMYRGLIAGVSTIDDTVRILGKPRSKVFASEHLFCKYQLVDVKIDKQDKKVLAIIIRDQAFKDVNGIVLGDPYDKVVRKVKVKGQGTTLIDAEHGVVYGFDQAGAVESILYTPLATK